MRLNESCLCRLLNPFVQSSPSLQKKACWVVVEWIILMSVSINQSIIHSLSKRKTLLFVSMRFWEMELDWWGIHVVIACSIWCVWIIKQMQDFVVSCLCHWDSRKWNLDWWGIHVYCSLVFVNDSTESQRHQARILWPAYYIYIYI